MQFSKYTCIAWKSLHQPCRLHPEPCLYVFCRTPYCMMPWQMYSVPKNPVRQEDRKSLLPSLCQGPAP